MADIKLDPATLLAMLQGDEEAKAKLLEVAQEAVDAEKTKKQVSDTEGIIAAFLATWMEAEIVEILPPLCVKLLKAEFEWHPEVGQFELSKRGLYTEFDGEMVSEEMLLLIDAVSSAENTDDLILEDMESFIREHLGDSRFNQILSQSGWLYTKTQLLDKLTTGHSSKFSNGIEPVDGKIGGQSKGTVILLYNAVGVGDVPGWSISVKLGRTAKKGGNGRRITNGSGKRVNLKEYGHQTIRDYFLDTFVRAGCKYPDTRAIDLVAEHGEKSNKYNYTDLILRAEEDIPEDMRLYTNAKKALA